MPTGRASTPPTFDHRVVADFNRSIPPLLPIFEQRLSEALAAMSADGSVLTEATNARAGGTTRNRSAAAAWVSQRFKRQIDPDQVLVTNGSQGAILLLLERFVGQGGLLLTEELTYTPLPQLAQRAHIRLVGLALDNEGIIPESFAAACRQERPAALYCNPTDHNPTTATMSEQRRMKIAEIARQYAVPIIEDDPLGLMHSDAPRPIAALAPDICWYVMGATKTLAHGFRFAALVGPSPEAVEQFVTPIRSLSHWFAAPLPSSIMTTWIEARVADEIREAIGHEIAARNKIALDVLSEFAVHSTPRGMHIWVEISADVPRLELVKKLADRGVLARPSDAFSVNGAVVIPNAIRMSLGAPENADIVALGLRQVAETVREW